MSTKRMLAFVAVTLLAGCGTRVQQAAPAASPGPLGPGHVEAPSVAGSGPAQLPANGGSAGTSGPAQGATAVAPTGSASGSASLKNGAPSVSRSPQTASVPKDAARLGGASGETSSAPAPFRAGQPAPAPTPGTPADPPAGRSPLVLGNVGDYGGPPGAVTTGILRGAQLWVQYINGREGLNGHPVKLIVYDAGGDPARRKAVLREAVERQKVVAFLDDNGVLTGSSTVDYFDSVHIPVVGSSTGNSYIYDSPMFFPQATSGLPLFDSGLRGLAQQLVPKGKSKVATLVCVEVPDCDQVAQLWAKTSREVGLQLVNQTKASLTQPDFTAECLRIQQAGADSIGIAADSNTVVRMAASCARQNYHPAFMTVAGIVFDSWKADPLLDGFVGGSNFYPWFRNDTPAMQEYNQARQQYAKDLVGLGPLSGWVAGKLLERAAAQLPEPPTSAAILQGLWNLKDETLGGLTATPLTFGEGRKPTQSECWFNVALSKGSWVTADDAARHCL